MKEEKHWPDRVELSLDNRQIFLLFFVSAVVICLIFALGVVVGKRMDRSPTRPTPTDPLALLDQMGNDSGEETLTFQEKLTAEKPTKAPAPAAADPVSPAPEAPAEAAAVHAESRTVAKATPRPAAQPRPQNVAPPSVAVSSGDHKPVAVPAPRRQRASEATGPTAVAADSGKKETAKPTKVPLEEKAEAAASDGSYTLQLSSFQERREAETFMQKLRGAGMKPYMTPTTIPGRGVWFRVRLGKYKSWDDALAAKQDFEKKQQVIAYVSKN